MEFEIPAKPLGMSDFALPHPGCTNGRASQQGTARAVCLCAPAERFCAIDMRALRDSTKSGNVYCVPYVHELIAHPDKPNYFRASRTHFAQALTNIWVSRSTEIN